MSATTITCCLCSADWRSLLRWALASYTAIHQQTGLKVHIKQTYASVPACCFFQDYEMLTIQHRNIERLLACYQTKEDEPAKDESEPATILWIVNEHLPVLLSDVVELWQFMRLNEAQVAFICREV
jgi:hypothetical protein